jgi:hypothetical protein
MIQNISRAGARFESAQIYSAGDAVLAKIPWGDWARAGEIPARIVRVENCASPSSCAPLSNPLAGMSAILSSVAVRWDAPEKPDARVRAAWRSVTVPGDLFREMPVCFA